MKRGVLLINLGTPDAPQTGSVRRYLAEFLMDPFVVDVAWPLRALLVYGLILPKRPSSSARAYQKVWTKDGSPLAVFHSRLVERVARLLGPDIPLFSAMRYGRPSIQSALEKAREANLDELIVFPLYPQYSLAATESSIHKVKSEAKRQGARFSLRFVEPFYDEAEFIDSFSEVAAPCLRSISWDHLVFSFHGLPERQIKKLAQPGSPCLEDNHSCESVGAKNSLCYRAQCFTTARSLATRLGIEPGKYTVAFQSRLGRTPWIKPYTDLVYLDLAKKGVKNLAVMCPAFVADCLETLEEVEIRGKQSFVGAGGRSLTLIPSLNDSERWAKGVVRMLRLGDN